ncbi:hypothetical protein D9M71_785980 [compost metagenome]
MQGAARLHAERAGVELIQGQALGRLFNLVLGCRATFLLARAGDEINEDNELAQANAQCFDDHDLILRTIKNRPVQAGFFKGPIT